MSSSQVNFVRGQGFLRADDASCGIRFPGLMFQPRIIAILTGVGIVTQSAALFLALSIVLAWSALAPKWNPFEAIYNIAIARPRGLPPLTPAPAPRRFAQGMAATMMVIVGIALLLRYNVLAYVMEGILVTALLALVVGRFCLGSYLFHLISGNAKFANRTLPWS